MPRMRLVTSFLIVSALGLAQVKPVPPKGVAVSAADRTELETGLARLKQSLTGLKDNPLMPDVAIYYNAVRYALENDEFFKPEEVARAKDLLTQGRIRAANLAAKNTPWTTQTGLVVRGYVSKLDKSVQPYGLVIPPSYSPTAPHRWRLDTWFHGRNELLSEGNFITDRQKNPGEFTPRDTIVLHLYGRYCNANKLAGEVDLFEALEAVKRQYAIDENRIVVRGFSMGGAAAWHIAAHHAGLWAAAAPGAGFSETPDFLKIWAKEDLKPTWWEQKLWHLYDATDYAVNFFNLPLVAYNGDIDGQKQAADVMEKAMAAEKMRLTRVVGPQTGHKYHPDSKVEINRIVDANAERGREAYPRRVRFTTWTLAYNRMKWVTVEALGEHWKRARLDAEVTGERGIDVKTEHVEAFALEFGPGGCPLDPAAAPTVTVNGQRVLAAPPMSDRSWVGRFHRANGKWVAGPLPASLRKAHGLQGPIDDAFLDSFLMVKPTGTPMAPGVAKWVAGEQQHAITEWRRQFRGEAQVRDDSAVSDADIAASNLILWGDPGSNRVLARIADKLPVKWTAEAVMVGAKKYPAGTHAPVLIYPNPLNPKKYVVLNSGFTFREYDYLNNARQVPKLPDWAVIDTTTPPDERWPGKVVEAGFFGEKWEIVTR